ncbi:MAG: hypothetical protein J6L89_08165 [Clostridia bacterium]|nr:hypothetical protein [Clostridia bacterium]
MNVKIKVIIIAVIAGVFLIAIVAGIWYYKTKFYVPDKNGMVYESSDVVEQSDSSDDGKTQ